MFEFMRKAILFGAGLALTTTDKMEAAVEDLVKKGEITEKEGRELLNDMIARSKKAGEEFEAKVEQVVSSTLK